LEAIFTMENVSIMLSTAGLAAFIVSFLLKGANMKAILAINALGNILMVISYLCVSNANGALSSIVGAVVGIINYFYAAKEKKIPIWLLCCYAVAFVAVNIMVFTSWVDIFAIAASLAAVFMISASSGKGYRLWSICNDALWSVFDILRGSYGPLLTHGILTGFTLIGMFMHDFKRKAK